MYRVFLDAKLDNSSEPGLKSLGAYYIVAFLSQVTICIHILIAWLKIKILWTKSTRKLSGVLFMISHYAYMYLILMRLQTTSVTVFETIPDDWGWLSMLYIFLFISFGGKQLVYFGWKLYWNAPKSFVQVSSRPLLYRRMLTI